MKEDSKVKVKKETKVVKKAPKAVKAASVEKESAPKVEAKKVVTKSAAPKVSEEKIIQFAVGRRKRAVARVRMYAGKGEVIINEQPIEKLVSAANLKIFMRPLVSSGVLEDSKFTAKVVGGGSSGQIDAVQLGIARCIAKISEDLRKTMKQGGFLTRDPREKERKKFYHIRARKSPQYSKR